MSAHIPTERKVVSDLQVGDVVILRHDGDGSTSGALVTGRETESNVTTRLIFLFLADGEVGEFNYPVDDSLLMEVLV